MTKENNISLLHDVLFPFEPHLRFFLGGADPSGGEEVFTTHHFRADVTLLNVAVNFAGRLHRGRTLANGPRANFRLSRGEKWEQAHQGVGSADQPVQSGL